MVNARPSSHVYIPNFQSEAISDEDLIRGFLLDLGASGLRLKVRLPALQYPSAE